MFTKWISVQEATEKYQIKEDIIVFWIRHGKFTEIRQKGDKILLNVKKLDEYMHWRETAMVKPDYVDQVEMECSNQYLMVSVYKKILEALKAENDKLKIKSDLLEHCNRLALENLEEFVKEQRTILEKAILIDKE